MLVPNEAWTSRAPWWQRSSRFHVKTEQLVETKKATSCQASVEASQWTCQISSPGCGSLARFPQGESDSYWLILTRIHSVNPETACGWEEVGWPWNQVRGQVGRSKSETGVGNQSCLLYCSSSSFLEKSWTPKIGIPSMEINLITVFGQHSSWFLVTHSMLLPLIQLCSWNSVSLSSSLLPSNSVLLTSQSL